MQSVIGRLDDSVMRMIEDSVDESSKPRLSASEEREEAVKEKVMSENVSENEDKK